MPEYIMRYDMGEESDIVERYVKWLKKYADDETIFIVQENPRGDNLHLHSMFKSEHAIKKIRDNFIYTFKSTFRDTRSYSLSEKEGNILYLCKGPKAISKMKDPKYPGIREDPIVLYQGSNYTDQDVIKSHNDWWEQAKNMKIGKVEKEEKLNELDSMYDYVKKIAVSPHDKKMLPGFDEDRLMETVVDYYIKNRKTIRYSLLSEYCDTLWLLLLSHCGYDKEYRESRSQVVQNLKNYRSKKY